MGELSARHLAPYHLVPADTKKGLARSYTQPHTAMMLAEPRAKLPLQSFIGDGQASSSKISSIIIIFRETLTKRQQKGTIIFQTVSQKPKPTMHRERNKFICSRFMVALFKFILILLLQAFFSFLDSIRLGNGVWSSVSGVAKTH